MTLGSWVTCAELLAGAQGPGPADGPPPGAFPEPAARQAAQRLQWPLADTRIAGAAILNSDRRLQCQRRSGHSAQSGAGALATAAGCKQDPSLQHCTEL